MLAQGNKIEAIRVLREATGLGLAEAKAAVEHLAETGEMPAVVPEAKVPTDLPLEVENLARSGKTVEAIKLLRDRTKISLYDAKRLVDKVPLETGARRSGCLGLLLLAFAIAYGVS